MRQNHEAKDLTSFLSVLDPSQTHPSFPPTEQGTGAALGPRDTHVTRQLGPPRPPWVLEQLHAQGQLGILDSPTLAFYTAEIINVGHHTQSLYCSVFT